MFADDIKLWSVIRTADDEEHLQANLNRLQQWSKAWLLPFNEKKCNILRVGRARSPNHMAYCLNGIPLQEVDSQKDVGVWITTSLKPSLHCTKIAKSAMSVLYLVKRAFSAFDEDCFAKVFRTFVRPQLEFAIQAWRPWTAKDLSILERVQRRATKLVAGQGSLPYATRQLRGDLIQVFRIIRGQDCSLVPGDFFELATTTNLRGHPLKLRVTGARLDTRKFFFSNRVVEAWNALPVDVVMSASVEELAVETIELLLGEKYDETENCFGHAQIIQLRKFCLKTYFTFDGTIYEQVKGTPMDSPISGLIAEAVLQRLKSLVFRHHRQKLWTQYVDDTFVVIEWERVLTFKEHLNAIFSDIQFTMEEEEEDEEEEEEEEENNQLAFLHLPVYRKVCGGLKTKVFRTAPNTTRILNFNDNHPVSHKRNCVRALYRRVETHCSKMEDKVAELQYLRWIMRANGYPRNFVNQCIRKGHHRPNPTGPKFWRALPYMKNVSEAVSRLLTPLGVGVAQRPEATIRRQVMRPKDPLPRQETSGVVYRIWCSCGQSNYVGETGRLLRMRFAEHVAAVRRRDASSRVAAHSTGPGHIFTFQEDKILARGDNRKNRELLESWFSGPQSINKHNDLPVPYSVLRFSLGMRISHVGRTRASNYRSDSEPVFRAIVTPASSTDDEIAASTDSDSDRQATTASITTPVVIAKTVNGSVHTVPRQPRAIDTARLVPPSPLSANVSDAGFE
nr:unnamed protein product [Spirometra erinaceieuropaei]